MQKLFSWTGLLATGVLMVGGSMRVEGQPSPATIPGPQAPKMVTKVFEVAELVCLPSDFTISGTISQTHPAPNVEVCGDRLVTQITSMIAPGTWDVDGGAGRIEFFEKSRSLVVCHTTETVNRVAAALEKLKKRQNTTVAFTTQLIRLPVGTCDKFLAQFHYDPNSRGTGAAIGPLNGEQEATFLESVNRCPAGSIILSPKLSVFHGQTATVATGEAKPVVQNRIYTLAGGLGYAIPETTSMRPTGFSLSVCPLVSADQKSMRVRLGWESSTVQPGVITLNSGSKVSLETFQDGKPAGPAEVELREETGAFNLKTCQSDFRIPNDGTLLFDLGITKKGEVCEQCYLLLSASVVLSAEEERNVRVAPPRALTVVATYPPIPAPSFLGPPPPVPTSPATSFEWPQVYAQTLFVKMAPEAATQHGLTNSSSVLESKQVDVLLSEFQKTNPGCEVFSAPQLLLVDKPVGYFQDWQSDGSQFQTLRMTPTFSADRRFVRLKLEAECVGNGRQCCDVETTLPDGGTTCLMLNPKPGEKPSVGRTYMFVTPHLLLSAQDKDRLSAEMTTGMKINSCPVTSPPPVPVAVHVPGVGLTQVSYPQVDWVPVDRKAKAAEWVRAYEKACGGAPGPSPAECAMRALAEDPHCFAKPGSK